MGGFYDPPAQNRRDRIGEANRIVVGRPPPLDESESITGDWRYAQTHGGATGEEVIT